MRCKRMGVQDGESYNEATPKSCAFRGWACILWMVSGEYQNLLSNGDKVRGDAYVCSPFDEKSAGQFIVGRQLGYQERSP